MKQYYDLAHARQRLEGSVVALDGRYVRILAVSEGGKRGQYRIHYHVLGDDQSSHAIGYLPSQKIEVDRLTLGLGNFTRVGEVSAVYISRMPVRNWKDGLSTHNVYACRIDGERLSGRQCDSLLSSPYLIQIFTNTYPEFEEAKKLCKTGNSRGVAFSRHFALNRNEDLLFRDKGVVGLAGKEPILKEKFFFLKELLEQELH